MIDISFIYHYNKFDYLYIILYYIKSKMALFQTKTFAKDDEYMTPYYAWKNIEKYLPKDKVIWEAFYGDGTSKNSLNKLGCTNVIHKDIDFFEHNLGEVIISNPPFTLKKKVLYRLAEIDKPFILIMPCSTITTQYFRKTFSNKNIQIIIPRSRIQFFRKNTDKTINRCNFDCFYYCYKMNLPKDILHLGDEENCKIK